MDFELKAEAIALDFYPVQDIDLNGGMPAYGLQCECPLTGTKNYALEIEYCNPEEGASIVLKCPECQMYVPIWDYVNEHGGALWTDEQDGIPVSVTWISTYGANRYDPSDGELSGLIRKNEKESNE